MLLLYSCASLDQSLTENVTQSICNMTLNTCGQKSPHMRLHFQIKQFVIFQFCNVTEGYFFLNMSITMYMVLWCFWTLCYVKKHLGWFPLFLNAQ